MGADLRAAFKSRLIANTWLLRHLIKVKANGHIHILNYGFALTLTL